MAYARCYQPLGFVNEEVTVVSTSVTTHIFGPLVFSAATGSLVAAALCSVWAALSDQAHGFGSALGAAALVFAYFVSGQLIERVALQLANRQGMILIVSGYIGRVALLGVLLWWALSSSMVGSLVSPLWVGAGALVTVVGWLSGLIVGHSRMRIQVYDRPYVTPEGWDA